MPYTLGLMDWIGDLSLTSSTAQWVFLGVLILSGVFAAIGLVHTARRKATVISLLLGILIPVFIYLVLEKWWQPFPDHVPKYIYASAMGACFVTAAACSVTGRRLILVLPALVSIISVAGMANLYYQQYPTVESLAPRPVSVSMDYEQFRATTKPPMLKGREVGALVDIDFPAPKSEFKHRPGQVYIPPAYFNNPDKKLPVIVLLAGNPGTPTEWFGVGDASRTLDLFQTKHNGEAPIVFSIDGTGTLYGNPLCVDGVKGNVETWLTEDVPTGIKKHFRVDEDQRHWTIGGLSYGGTCSLQIVSNKPDSYGTFLDMSGEPEPSVGDHDSTVELFYYGNEQAFYDKDPYTLLTRAARSGSKKYHHIQGRFVCGDKDNLAREASEKLSRAASEAGIENEYWTVHGGHNYSVWRVAFRQLLPFAARRGGLDVNVEVK